MSRIKISKYSYVFFLILLILATIDGCATASKNRQLVKNVSDRATNGMRLLPIDPPPNVVLEAYTRSKQSHWIDSIFSQGKFVILDDESVWKIDSTESEKTKSWVRNEKILICEETYNEYIFYHMLNIDSQNKVQAAYIGHSILRTRIQGHYNGWEGNNIYKLANGNVLKQMTYQYQNHYSYSPEAIVISYSGAYFLLVDGVNETVGVIVIQ